MADEHHSSPRHTPSGRLERLIRLLLEVTTLNAPAPGPLAKRLGIAPSTLRKDLGVLRRASGLALSWSRRDKRWVLGDGRSALPLERGTLDPVVAIIADRATRGDQATRAISAEAVRRLAAAVGDRIRARLPAIESGRELPFLGTLLLAIERGERVELTYDSRRLGRINRVQFDPYRLVFSDGHLYVEGLRLDVHAIRRHRLDRIRAVRGTGMLLPAPLVEYDPETIDRYRVGLFDDDPVTEIRVRFEPSVADLVESESPCREVEYHPLEGGGCLAIYRVKAIDAFIRWVLRWGDAMTVVGPEDVQRRVRRLLAAMLVRHRPFMTEQPEVHLRLVEGEP